MQSQNLSTPTGDRQEVVDHDRPIKVVEFGSIGESVAGAGALVLAILGLCHVLPEYMVGIATLCAGAALAIEGLAVSSHFKALEDEINHTAKTRVVLESGMAFELIGGAAGIVLGILALLRFVPEVLIPVAAIAMGASLLLGTGAVERIDKLRMYYGTSHRAILRWTHGTVIGSAGLQALCGCAGIVLGILALLGELPQTLSLIAMLCIGGSVLLTGAAVGGKMAASH